MPVPTMDQEEVPLRKPGLSRTRIAIGATVVVAVGLLVLAQHTSMAPLPHRLDETLAGILAGACFGFAMYAVRRAAG
jgi:flagellar biosynthesis protein FliR